MRPHFLAIVVWLALAPGATRADDVPTFHKDVAPLLFARCATCHRPGEVAPFPLLTYQHARKRAQDIALVAASRTMPPWKPKAGAEVFRDARMLDDREVAVLQAWAEAGAPEGDPSDAPPRPTFPEGWHLGEPDLVVKVARAFTVPAQGPDVYVHFVLPLAFQEDKYLRAVQVLPSNRRVAHHGVPILDGGTARKLAQKHGRDHYPNFGGPGFIPRGFLPGYAPGQTTRFDPDSPTGLTLGKGLDIVLQMHYHPTGKEETDEPRVGLYFTSERPKRNPGLVLLGNNDLDIPAGERAFQRADAFKLPVDFEVANIWCHMHMIGKSVRVWADPPGGPRRDLLQIDDWDFNWQDTYTYKTPFTLPKGTVVHAEWTWDNSADNPRNPNDPPKRVVWGEGSADEMSGLILGEMTLNPSDEGALWLGVLGHYLEVEWKAQEARRKRERGGEAAIRP